MPLLDHFHEPLWPNRQWHAFHNAWATMIAGEVNKRLPEGYFAEGNVEFNIEIDVAALRQPGEPSTVESTWTPPAPVLTVPFTSTTDVVEVLIYESSGGASLVGAIELVSPANKDRDATRNAFVSKCASYLQQGIGLVVIDVVTTRKANLHNLLMQRVSGGATDWISELYAVAYHPVQEMAQPLLGPRNGEIAKSLEIWPHELKIGQPLPTVPLCLKGGLSVPLTLESSYVRTCQEYRISLNGK
jgi:hypothetical protein